MEDHGLHGPHGPEARRPVARQAALERKRRYRKRLRDGVVSLRVDVAEVALAEALLRAGRIDERAALDRTRLAQAVEAVVGEWIARWIKGRR